MNPPSLTARLASGLAVSLLFLAAPAAAQSPAEEFHKAYYLEHETGDLEGALALYEKVANDQKAPAELRDRAARFARGVAEELACADFAALVPADSLFYLELNRPGAQLERLLGQLGLLGADGERLGISPHLIEGVLGMRGAAVAITEIDPRRGPTGGVAIVHPGDLEVVRGLLATALPVGGRHEEPIDGHATYSIEGEVFVTLTSRLLIAGRKREDVAGVLARLRGDGAGSLARDPRMAGAMALRGSDLVFCCLNLQPIMPMILDAARQQARRDPGLAAALKFLDLPSTRTVVARAGVDPDGLSLDLAVELAEGHHNLAFNLMRMPNLDAEALSLVPAGPAFFCVGAVNRRGAVPPGVEGAAGEPVVTAMDFGRELFANVAEVAAFVMPDVQRAPWGAMPDVGLAMRVNDPARSRALWQLLLGTAAAVAGSEPGAPERRGDATVQRFTIERSPVFLAQAGDRLILTPSERLVDAAVEAARSGRTVGADPVFAHALERVGQGSTMVAAANLGRCSAIATHFMSERERREAEPFFHLLQGTTLSFGVVQTHNRLGVHGCVVGIPDIGPMVTELVARELHRGGGRAVASQRATAGTAARRPEAPVAADAPPDAEQLRARFQAAHERGRLDEARQLARAYGAAVAGEAMALNNFAWALLTEEQYGGNYREVALRLSKASNEASDWGNWYYVDTYARALFEEGRIDEAIEHQVKAVELAGDDPRVGEARAALERYLEAHKKRMIR